MHPRSLPTRQRQGGMFLLEVLVAIVIFSVGILAILGLQARAIQSVTDDQFRADANFFANKIIGLMWADRANLAAYAHQPGGSCAAGFSGAAGTAPALSDWAAEVQTRMAQGADRQQVIVGADNRVTVTICWVTPSSNTPRQHQVVTWIQG